nr:MAG TPA: hypothetical protein [Caudoviricetes sp.]
MNSWAGSDSGYCGGDNHIGCVHCHFAGDKEHNEKMIATDSTYGYGVLPCGKKEFTGEYEIGHKDYELMRKLCKAGTDHRKFMRMITVYTDVTAPLYWWKEFDTYKVGTVANSCSTMHKIPEKEFTLDNFSHEHLNSEDHHRDWIKSAVVNEDETSLHKVWATPLDILKFTIEMLNSYRTAYIESNDKDDWWQMIQLLPSSYNQKRTLMLNYEVLANIYKSRRGHKLDEWKMFCEWIETLPYSELITGKTEVR